MELNVDWTTIKDFVNARSLSVQYFAYQGTYFIWAFDGPVELMARIPIVSPTPNPSDQYDFETNFISFANSSPKEIITTQFELRDKTLKLISASGTIGLDGTVSILLKVHGTTNPTGDTTLDGRWISSG